MKTAGHLLSIVFIPDMRYIFWVQHTYSKLYWTRSTLLTNEEFIIWPFVGAGYPQNMNTYSANSGTCRTLWENSPFEKTTSWDQFDFFHSWTYLKGHVYKIMGVKGQLVACHSQSKSVMPEKTAGNPLKNSGVPNDIGIYDRMLPHPVKQWRVKV